MVGYRDIAHHAEFDHVGTEFGVYDSPQNDDSRNHDIFLLATDGSRETALVEHPANDFAPFWTPEGDRIVFASDRSGNMGLWILEVVDGKPKGSPQLISDNLNGMFPLGMTQDGSYYYGLISSDVDVYMATLDPETGEVVTPPTKTIQSLEGFNYSPAFSPDGKHVVYMSLRPTGPYTDFRAIVIRSLETGEERVLSPELTRYGRLPQWSPDGRSIIAWAQGADKRSGLYQIDIETDAATSVVLDDGQAFDEHGCIPAIISPVWSPDGNRIFFVRERNNLMTIRAYDFDTEREWSPDFRSEHVKGCRKHVLALSPDGQQLAFMECFDGLHSYQIAPSAGGETREILRLPGEEMPFFQGETWLEWTRDGRHLLFGRRKDEATELWRISTEGGEPQDLGLKMRKMDHLNVHPDGRRVTFTGPGSGRGTEVWVMENILPTASK